MPEECGGDTFLTKPADIRAFGVMRYHCLYRKLLFPLDEGGKTVASTAYSLRSCLKVGNWKYPQINSFLNPLAI